MRQRIMPERDAAAGRRLPDQTSGPITGRRWLSEPRTAVWLVVAITVLVGAVRKISAWWKARVAVSRLGEPNVTPDQIEAVAEHGRAGVYELLAFLARRPWLLNAWPLAVRLRVFGCSISSLPRKRRRSFGEDTR